MTALETYLRTLTSQQLISCYNINGRQHLFTTLSATPEEKYEDYLRISPDLLSRLPLHMIAGMFD